MELGAVNPAMKHAVALAGLKEYFDIEVLKVLLPAIPEAAKKGLLAEQQSSTQAGNMLLREQLDKLAQLNRKMMTDALASEDPAVQKAAMTAGRDMFNMLAKFEETINSQERMLAIENAVQDSIRELDNAEVRDVFLRNLRLRLGEANKNSQNS